MGGDEAGGLVGFHLCLGDDVAQSMVFAPAGMKLEGLGGDHVLWGNDVVPGIGCNRVFGIVSGGVNVVGGSVCLIWCPACLCSCLR